MLATTNRPEHVESSHAATPPAPGPSRLAVTKILANHASPTKMRSSRPLTDTEENKRRLALSSNPVWKTTSPPTVRSHVRKIAGRNQTLWCVYLLKYNNHHSAARRGKKKQSPQFDSQREAEAQIFATRYNLETKASRTLVDAQLLATEAETADPTTAPRPEKRRRVSNDPVDTRAKSMSQNPAIRNAVAAPVDMNPKGAGAFNRYNDDTSKFLDGCANMIKFNHCKTETKS